MAQITIDTTTDLSRYDFSGSSLPSDWNIIQQGTGMTVSVASSVLSITSGTTINDQTIIRCTNKFRVKAYARFVAQISQRIINQNIFLEVTNEAGTTFARYNFNGTNATTVDCLTGNSGTANSAASVACPTTSSYTTFDIYADAQNVVFSSAASNTNAVKSGIASFDRLILDPTEDYFIQIRVLNGATAPASSTTVSIDAVVLQDLTGVMVDVSRGDGTAALTNAAPVQVVNTPTVSAVQSGTWTVRATEALGTATTIGALNANVTGALTGASSIGVVITAVTSPSGITLTPQVSYDGGSNYVTTKFYDPVLENVEDTIPNASLAVGFSRSIVVDGGVTHARVVATGYTSGSVAVRLSASNATSLVALKSGIQHDAPASLYMQMVGAIGSTTTPTAVNNNGDAVRLWATTNGALNIADAGGSITVDGTVAATQSGTWTVQPGNTANSTPWLVTNRANIYYNETTTAQAASATYTGASRDTAIAAGSVNPFAKFNAVAFADQAGTLRIEMSMDNATWRRATADTAVAAGSTVYLTVPVTTRYHRAVYVNGATLQGQFMLNTSYTAA